MKVKRTSGFTLVEIMISTLILAVLALGGAAVLYRTGGGVQVQGNKRIAMELARSQIEALQAEDYLVLVTQAPFSDTEGVTVNDVSMTLSMDVIYHPVDSTDPDPADVGPLGNEYLELKVEVRYGQSAEEKVVMNTTKVLLM
jgi:prepilin-type N-terminal cleavage/methylation domain-containing protein